MFSRLKQRMRDMRTIKTLCQGAERHANADGQTEPGLEHFFLAALDLPDGSARRAFEQIGADPDRFKHAIAQQYRDALQSIGVAPASLDAINEEVVPVLPGEGLYTAKPSVQALMRQLAGWPKAHPAEPLVGAHVVAASATVKQGIASRALRAMGVDAEALAGAARAELNATGGG